MTRPPRAPGLCTTAIHAGEPPDPVTGASAPNLVMSSTFVVDRPLPFSALDMGEDAPWLYTRWANPTTRQLEDKLAVDYSMTTAFKVGTVIQHPQFGLGLVQNNVGPGKIEVLFEDGKKKMRCL